MQVKQSEAALKNSLIAVISSICYSRQLFSEANFKEIQITQGTSLQAFSLREADEEVCEIAKWLDKVAAPYINRKELAKLVFALLDPAEGEGAERNLQDGFEFTIEYRSEADSTESEDSVQSQLVQMVRVVRTFFNEPMNKNGGLGKGEIGLKMYLTAGETAVCGAATETHSAIEDTTFAEALEDCPPATRSAEVNIGQIVLPAHVLTVRAISAAGASDEESGDETRGAEELSARSLSRSHSESARGSQATQVSVAQSVRHSVVEDPIIQNASPQQP